MPRGPSDAGPLALELAQDEPSADDAGAPHARTTTFADVREVWAGGGEDAETSAVIREHVSQLFADFSVHARRTEISCTREVCRAHLAFEDAAALRALLEIPVDDAAQIRSGPPEILADGVGVEILWVRDTEETPF